MTTMRVYVDTVAQDPATAFAHSITVNGPGGTALSQPGSPGSFANSYAFSSPVGARWTWYSGGSAGGYLVQ